ncbi:capsular biosynthesis protein [Phenylobacterium aquaticum]|uniref:capsular biosynthesis protein n=1 Tax=Phenylobacterium aquaticum TaxID=1763816 RepID=UPI001F5CD363|nr:capsular biosynthesis protein [Phenylobacterium aquaticum]MCI3132736.1 capsular biosynthesis protein [Phenylobacterium aquaticum]
MIVFAMAGQSRRFTEAGYDRPKFMLEVGVATAFDYSVAGFLDHFADEPFVFVYRETSGVRDFLNARLTALGVANPRLVELNAPTSGQAETVERGLKGLGDTTGELTIFNIDTFRRNFTAPAAAARGDGYLEVFEGSGANWSFARTESPDSDRVVQTTEKDPISNLCCTGLYHFRRIHDFMWALARERVAPTTTLGETYVAPIYNHLIQRGADIRRHLVQAEDVIFCGVPAEYEALVADPGQLASLTLRIGA